MFDPNLKKWQSQELIPKLLGQCEVIDCREMDFCILVELPNGKSATNGVILSVLYTTFNGMYQLKERVFKTPSGGIFF